MEFSTLTDWRNTRRRQIIQFIFQFEDPICLYLCIPWRQGCSQRTCQSTDLSFSIHWPSFVFHTSSIVLSLLSVVERYFRWWSLHIPPRLIKYWCPPASCLPLAFAIFFYTNCKYIYYSWNKNMIFKPWWSFDFFLNMRGFIDLRWNLHFNTLWFLLIYFFLTKFDCF